MEHLIFIILLISVSYLLSKFEIQIEGSEGWAAKLPTWRINLKLGIPYLNREITGYHFYGFLIMFLSLHSVFIFIPWNIFIELRLLSFYMFMIVIEDFLWFVLNPNYGLNKFNKANVTWHKFWFLKFPVDYWIIIPVATFAYYLSNLV